MHKYIWLRSLDSALQIIKSTFKNRDTQISNMSKTSLKKWVQSKKLNPSQVIQENESKLYEGKIRHRSEQRAIIQQHHTICLPLEKWSFHKRWLGKDRYHIYLVSSFWPNSVDQVTMYQIIWVTWNCMGNVEILGGWR